MKSGFHLPHPTSVIYYKFAGVSCSDTSNYKGGNLLYSNYNFNEQPQLYKIKYRTVIKINFITTGLCAELKNQHCGAGSVHENFMKEHCRKSCGLCGK